MSRQRSQPRAIGLAGFEAKRMGKKTSVRIALDTSLPVRAGSCENRFYFCSRYFFGVRLRKIN